MGECLITRRGGEPYELPTLSGGYPANVSVVQAAGASASFSVQISIPGKPAEYAYQWYFNGAAVSGAVSASYTRTGLTAAGSHTLYCAVTNKAGTVTSRVATLTVIAAIPAYTFTGSSQVIDDGNYNWRIKFLTSGTLTFTELGNAANGIDVFLVGGGGGCGPGTAGRGGGGGGYTGASWSVALAKNTGYAIAIGAGGAANGNGGTSSAFGTSITGGYIGTGDNKGGNGGSGGGGGSGTEGGGTGGSNGGNGSSLYGTKSGVGQGTTTREFGDPSGALYAGGGGGGSNGVGGAGGGASVGSSALANTGGGGGGGGGMGGSGIVVIRNRR